ncbi:MAG: ADP-ribose pyrophosphatase [Phycisphaerae bacterium]|nr:MAG: ADP-ribose pyrophosphatase [Phycisphaerae bacterium]
MVEKRSLLSTPKFDVELWKVALSDGREVDRQVVVHPGAVTILAICDDESIVMIRNRRFAADQVLLELPAGTLEADEDPKACALRELVEETGYRAKSIKPLVEFYTSPGICTERMYAFVARDLTQVGQNLDDTEEIDVEIVAADKIRQDLIDGTLLDGKTMAVLGTYFAIEDAKRGCELKS